MKNNKKQRSTINIYLQNNENVTTTNYFEDLAKLEDIMKNGGELNTNQLALLSSVVMNDKVHGNGYGIDQCNVYSGEEMSWKVYVKKERHGFLRPKKVICCEFNENPVQVSLRSYSDLLKLFIKGALGSAKSYQEAQWKEPTFDEPEPKKEKKEENKPPKEEKPKEPEWKEPVIEDNNNPDPEENPMDDKNEPDKEKE